ncbi:unnamed protein product [Gulo gulo]|uniref:Uncharacterized protein n=1 Tax=Gulo gulo TaxID=48420 RepID=A0A9X9LNF2_GULGU|nr:unnamed protein product [Gulo gulo]
MVYYRFTNMERERSERTATVWLCEELTVLLLRPGSVSFPSEMFGFLLPCVPGAPSGARLSQIGQCRAPTGCCLRSPSFPEPAHGGCFPAAALSSLEQ